MTVRDLIKLLQDKPQDATVFVSTNDGNDVDEVFDVTLSEDAPEDEVYIEY